ncbi:patatin-like phospholipase family protein [Arthrobacter sp. ISL-85]|uniref:patatin-like phospholipase family protein n=1 Tax=Arthrobacter sp. ISL-85 TaxID=2819115 RepID=UPI001BE61700|nr:patatin-like phospholipase family protein [Arthrobacter sp. ISL-85]MBT2567862.1 patatin-like phospholipase family protein [Arthrobacter sp. ISL-85]
MNTTPSSIPHTDSTVSSRRALVLGGGGSTGNAWLIGVLAGLADAGLDVTGADRIIGTSAGSTAAAQISGASPGELYASILRAPLPQRTRPPGTHAAGQGVPSHLERTDRIIAASATASDMRRRMGAAALELVAAHDGSERWRTTVAARLPVHGWPEHELLITAVDAATGEATVFDRRSGINLVDAVAASCSSASAYQIGDNSYIDGGYRRNENADLAAGCGRVLVLSPFSGRTRMPLEWGMQLAAQVEELRSAGSKVAVISPDSEADYMFGANAMDLSLRPAAAQAGYNQGKACAGRLAEFWR